MKRQRGIALIMMLFLLVALSTSLFALHSAILIQEKTNFYSSRSIKLQLAAEASIYEGLNTFLTLQQEDNFTFQGNYDVGGITFDVTITNEAGKLDLNTCSLSDVTRLAEGVGISLDRAANITTKLSLLREQKNYLYSVQELVTEKLVSPEEFGVLAEHLTIWSGLVRPDYRYSSQLLRSALELLPSNIAGLSAAPSIMTVTVSAVAHDAQQIKASGVFFIDRSAELDMNITMLRWSD